MFFLNYSFFLVLCFVLRFLLIFELLLRKACVLMFRRWLASRCQFSQRPFIQPAVESRNVVFHSSLIVTGEALGVVVRTGDKTMIGSVAKLASQTETSETTMQREIKHFVRIITILAVVMGVFFFIVGVARGQPVADVFIFGFVTIIVANVPQGNYFCFVCFKNILFKITLNRFACNCDIIVVDYGRTIA